MNACEKSKQSCMAYCRSKGISYHKFKYWTTKLHDKSTPLKATPVRVQVQKEESPFVLCRFTFQAGCELSVYDHSVLPSLLKALL